MHLLSREDQTTCTSSTVTPSDQTITLSNQTISNPSDQTTSSAVAPSQQTTPSALPSTAASIIQDSDGMFIALLHFCDSLNFEWLLHHCIFQTSPCPLCLHRPKSHMLLVTRTQTPQTLVSDVYQLNLVEGN